METYVLPPNSNKIIKFKSYYVVWKHKGVSAVTKSPARFKSYYVVWKHDSQKIPVFSLICSNHTILNIPKSYKQ